LLLGARRVFDREQTTDEFVAVQVLETDGVFLGRDEVKVEWG
jgi:hypothetical protein